MNATARRYGRTPKPIEFTVTETGCHECVSHFRDPDGYPRISVKCKTRQMSTVIYERRHGPIPKGMMVRHECDNPPCINIAHLILGSRADNIKDMVERGRSLHGERHRAAKLSFVDAMAIRGSAEPVKVLAERYGVSDRAVYLIRAGKRWRHEFAAHDAAKVA